MHVYVATCMHVYHAGAAWYTLCAMRVVNQALGRVIRHRADFGAILLADERFARTDMRNNISYWARSLLTVRDSCATLGGELQRFFRENEARAPPRRAAPLAAQHATAKVHTMGQARSLCGVAVYLVPSPQINTRGLSGFLGLWVKCTAPEKYRNGVRTAQRAWLPAAAKQSPCVRLQ